ncbi:MAG: hypothetical protein ACI9SQ_000414 [Rubritalea sp.]|jgi:hypothetical protein
MALSLRVGLGDEFIHMGLEYYSTILNIDPQW